MVVCGHDQASPSARNYSPCFAPQPWPRWWVRVSAGRRRLRARSLRRTRSIISILKTGETGRLAEPMTALAGLRGVVVIDEVQRRPELFSVLRRVGGSQAAAGPVSYLGQRVAGSPAPIVGVSSGAA